MCISFFRHQHQPNPVNTTIHTLSYRCNPVIKNGLLQMHRFLLVIGQLDCCLILNKTGKMF